MKLWMRCAVRLYPAAWRRRYGAEFEALLDDAPLHSADFWDILRGALTMQIKTWTFGKMAGGFSLAGLIVAAVIAFSSPRTYLSTAVIRLEPSTKTESAWLLDPGEQLSHVEQQVLSRQSLSKMIMDGNLYQRDRQEKPLEDIIQEMRNQYISIRMLPQPGKPDQPATAFSVSFQYENPAKAQWGTRALLSRFTEELPRAQSPVSGLTTIEILDPASLPERPVALNRPAIVGFGLLFGLLAGSVIFGAGRWPKVAVAAVATAGVTWIGSCFVPDYYLSNAVLRLGSEHAVQLVSQAVYDPAFLRSLIENPALNLYPVARRSRPVTEVVEQMRRDLRIQALQIPRGRQTAAILISFEYPDDERTFAPIRNHNGRYQAQAAVRAMVTHCMEASMADSAHPRVEVLDPASLPRQPHWPNRLFWVGLGLLAGLLPGIAWQFGARFRTSTVKPA